MAIKVSEAVQHKMVTANRRATPAKVFSEGLKAEFDPDHREEAAVDLPPPDDEVVQLVERLKGKVVELSGIHDPDNEEAPGLLFISLRLGKKTRERAREVVAYMRANPHLGKDHLLRIAKNPKGESWILCLQPRSRTTQDGIEYWLRPDLFDQDRMALQAICLDLHDTQHHLRVWVSTEPMTPEQQDQLREIFLELQRELPDYGAVRNRLDLRVPLEAEHHMPPLVRLKEDYVILGPITERVPSEQENREIHAIEEKLRKLRSQPGDRIVTVMIYRHALTTRIIHALNRLRTDPENRGLLKILARPEVREQYPELFTAVDTRRAIEKVSYEDVQKLIPAKDQKPAEPRRVVVSVPPGQDDREAAERVEVDTAGRRADPDFVRTVKEVRRAEREQREGRSWTRWIRRFVPGSRR